MVGTKETRAYRGKLAKRIPSTSKQKGNTLSLQLQVSVIVLCIFGFAYSRLSVIDELCMRSFHFILLSINHFLCWAGFGKSSPEWFRVYRRRGCDLHTPK